MYTHAVCIENLSFADTCVCVCFKECAYAYAFARVHMCIYIYIYIYIYTHTSKSRNTSSHHRLFWTYPYILEIVSKSASLELVNCLTLVTA
jgi:hypothetical protein